MDAEEGSKGGEASDLTELKAHEVQSAGTCLFPNSKEDFGRAYEGAKPTMDQTRLTLILRYLTTLKPFKAFVVRLLYIDYSSRTFNSVKFFILFGVRFLEWSSR